MISIWLGPPFIYFCIWKFDQIPPYFKLICSLFLYHCILRFLQIKSVQACASQTSGDSLKKALPPTREREREGERERQGETRRDRERQRETELKVFCGRLYRNLLKPSSRKFQPISFILTSRLLYFLENSNLPPPAFVLNTSPVLLQFDFSLQN